MDQKQFETTFNRHYPMLYRYVNSGVNNPEMAEEIAYECFIRLWGDRYKMESEAGTRGFLRMHARHAANRHLSKSKQTFADFQDYFDFTEMHYEGDQINEHGLHKLYARIDTLPDRVKQVINMTMEGFKISKIARKIGVSSRTVSILKNHAYKFIGELSNISNNNIKSTIAEISVIKDEINAELIRYFAKHPHKVHDIDANKFEKLVAELMKDMGYDVHLTPPTRDGGRDIIAVLNVPSNDQIVTIVECKRHRVDRPVGIDIVRSFLYTLREQDKANAGWIVTTSNFSQDALNKQKEYKWLLSLKDNRNLAAWCSNYGQWKKSSGSGGLWLPNNPLA
jgi:RNA polymerase sigma factor (sigma-70 family)